MKVFIHLNHGSDQSYLLTFPAGVTQKQIRRIAEGKFNEAVLVLMAKSTAKVPVPPQDRSMARLMADFTLEDGCMAERLA